MKRKTWALASLLLLIPFSLSAAELAAPRAEQKLVEWKFFRGELLDAREARADDQRFETVHIPHSMLIEPRLYKAGETFFRGLGWYVNSFVLDPALPRGQVLLRFEAVMARADVWLNGRPLGSHLGGYTPFSFDITSLVKSNGVNELVVKVDNRVMEVPPDGKLATQDYTLNGGIYREVSITGRPTTHVADIYVTASGISESEATVRVETIVENTGAKPMRPTVQMEMVEAASGLKALKLTAEPFPLAPGERRTLRLEGVVTNPSLWSPDHPNLYRVTVHLAGPSGKIIDSTSVRTGIRQIEFTPERGFFLNGKPLKLIGPNRHQTYAYLGNAVPDRYQRWDAQFMKDQGFNFVRASHYPQSRAFLDACDELGIMVYEELPGWNYIGGEAWKKLALQAVREMILRDRNRPSVILWGVRINEAPDDVPFTNKTNALAHELDPTRPTTGARIIGSYANFFEDVVSINDYTVMGPTLPGDKPHLLSETVGVNYQVKRGGKPIRERNHLEWHLFMLNRVYGDPRCSGEAFWEFHDTNSFLAINYMGVDASYLTKLWLEPWGHLWRWGVTDAWHIPKETLYAYTSQLVEEPFVHIPTAWDEHALRDVMVLHNCDAVELRLNGRSLGIKKPDASFRPNNWIRVEGYVMSKIFKRHGVPPVPEEIPYALPHPPTTFENVTYEPGELTARCLGTEEVLAEHTRRTPSRPTRIVLTPDFPAIHPDGSDMTRVVVALSDENGTLIHASDAEYQVVLSGPARLLADREPKLEAGMAAFYVQSSSFAAGVVEVKVRVPLLGLEQKGSIAVKAP